MNIDNATFPHATRSFIGVMGTDGSSRFGFIERESVNGDEAFVFFDNVSLAQPMPGPVIYAMMLAGLGRLGVVGCREKRPAS